MQQHARQKPHPHVPHRQPRRHQKHGGGLGVTRLAERAAGQLQAGHEQDHAQQRHRYHGKQRHHRVARHQRQQQQGAAQDHQRAASACAKGHVPGHTPRAVAHRHTTHSRAEYIHHAGGGGHLRVGHRAVGEQAVVFFAYADDRIAQRQRHLGQGQEDGPHHQVVPADAAPAPLRPLPGQRRGGELLQQLGPRQRCPTHTHGQQQKDARQAFAAGHQQRHQQARARQRPLLRHQPRALQHESQAQAKHDAL